MEELEYPYKSIPAYSTGEYKECGRNIDLKIMTIVFMAEDTVNLLCEKKNMSASGFITVSKLKKQINHCKNSLQKRSLEKQLNALYKERKSKSWKNKPLENKQNAMN